ncbi:MAG: hypothetical protein V1752_00480 [Candidatus Firestonebacteria bacterium]
MFCRFIEKNLSAYMDKETGRLVSYLISKHLVNCRSCRVKLGLFTSISEAAKQREKINLSADFMRVLKLKVAEEKAGRQTVSAPAAGKTAVALRVSLSALCLLLVFISLVLVFPRLQEKRINEFATVAFQTKAEVIDTGFGLEYATFTNQTRR